METIGSIVSRVLPPLIRRSEMSYQHTMQSVNTEKALQKLGLEITKRQGAYLYFPCPECQGLMTARQWGPDKNLTYCLKEKKGGNLVGLVEKMRSVTREEAEEFLKSTKATMRRIEGPPQRIYELEYHEYLKTKGIPEEVAKDYIIGVPKGKSMLAGCIAFGVHDKKGQLRFYYGVEMKTGKPKPYKELNPEMELYRFDQIDRQSDEIVVTTDLFQCVRNWMDDRQSVSNYGLPYLSPYQIERLNECDKICFQVGEEYVTEFAKTAARHITAWYRFELLPKQEEKAA